MYCYIWEYHVRPEHHSSFEAMYGPDGDWVRLFRTDPGYIRTDLVRDTSNPLRYITIDYWTSRQACLKFRKENRDRFDALDAAGDRLTSIERHIGDFDLIEKIPMERGRRGT